MESYEEQNKYSQLSYTAGLQNEQGFIQLRLNTETILDRIDKFLSGKKIVLKFNKKANSYYQEEESFGDPLVNDKGRAMLSHIIFMRINHHVVQGNFKMEHYDEFLERSRKEIAEQVVINCYEWEIADSKLNLVIDTIMSFIEPFISRLIDNKERDSYGQHFQTRELISDAKKKNPLTELGAGFK